MHLPASVPRFPKIELRYSVHKSSVRPPPYTTYRTGGSVPIPDIPIFLNARYQSQTLLNLVPRNINDFIPSIIYYLIKLLGFFPALEYRACILDFFPIGSKPSPYDPDISFTLFHDLPQMTLRTGRGSFLLPKIRDCKYAGVKSGLTKCSPVGNPFP